MAIAPAHTACAFHGSDLDRFQRRKDSRLHVLLPAGIAKVLFFIAIAIFLIFLIFLVMALMGGALVL